MSYEQIEGRLAAWAATQPAVRAVLAIGSRGRGDPDQWSDLDVLIFVTGRESYASDPGWLSNTGEVLVTYMEPTGIGDPEWYTVYEDGLKMDAVLMETEDASVDLDTLLMPFAHWDALRRGVHVLFDRQGEPRYLPPVEFTLEAPSGALFTNVTNGFLMAALTTAKFIQRGDFYRAQGWFANDLRPHLLRMAEWHAYGKDTWYGGRFKEQWADQRFLSLLPETFATFERESLKNALITMLDIMWTLGTETAERFGFQYPAAAYHTIVDLIMTIFSGG